MATSSLDTVFGIAKQSAKGTAATAFDTMRMTDVLAVPAITVEETNDEFGAGALLTPTSGGVRLGVYSRVNGTMRVRPDHIPLVFAAAGYAISSDAGPTEYTHTLTMETSDANYDWFGFLVQMGASGSVLDRRIDDARINRLRLIANQNAVARVEFEALGLHEEVAAGTETTTDETGPVLRTVSGTMTFNKEGGGALVSSIRACTIEWENSFPAPNDNMVIADHEMQDLPWLSQQISGTVDAAFSKAGFEEMFYGGASGAGSGYDFDDIQCNIVLKVESAGNISSNPYHLQITIPNMVARAQDFRASGRNEIRMPVAFTAYDDGTDEFCTVEILNDIASY